MKRSDETATTTWKGTTYMKVTYIENQLKLEDYLYLRKEVNWKALSPTQAQKALTNRLYTVHAVYNDKVIGMGRIVGDGAVICYIQDLIIHPEAQHMGIGSRIMDMLITYVDFLREEGTEMMLDLMCAKGRESFYEKKQFIARPTDTLGPGMIQILKDRG